MLYGAHPEPLWGTHVSCDVECSARSRATFFHATRSIPIMSPPRFSTFSEGDSPLETGGWRIAQFSGRRLREIQA